MQGLAAECIYIYELGAAQTQLLLRNLLLPVIEMSPQVGWQETPDSRVSKEEVKTAQEAEFGFIGFILLF